jgi:hypothetical protein
MSYYTTKTLIAGKPGTDKWVKKYGESLLCVRYKYDLKNGRKLKTVELLVENEPWDRDKERVPANKIVGIKVAYGEVNVARVVRQAGGVWNKKKQLWQLRYLDAVNLGLNDRIEPL